MKKILLISPYFYPNINPRPYRWTKIVEYWASQGHEVHVICEKRGVSPNANIAIHGVGYAAVKSFLPQQRGEVGNQKKQSSWKSTFFQWINDLIWKKIYFPDDSCIWYFSARNKALELLEKENFDLFVTSALPFTTHCVGLAIKKQFPNLTWIADTGDPFSIHKEVPFNNAFLYGKWSRKLEERVLRLADAVPVTTEATKKLYLQSFPTLDFLEKKMLVIPPLMTENGAENEVINPFFDKKNINIAYFGKFYQGIRTPDDLMLLATALVKERVDFAQKLQIHIFGDVFEPFAKQLNEHPNFVIHGLISRESVAAMMQAADFLVNISNQNDYQLPSKAPDYMQSGKPILNLYYTENDCFKDFFNHYPLILNCKHGATKTAEIIAFLEKNKEQKLSFDTIKQLTKPYTVEKIANDYLDISVWTNKHIGT